MNFSDLVAKSMEYLDLYCERNHPGFLAEPWNLFSNVALLIVGWWQIKRSQKPVPKILGVIAILVGIGSGLFHSLASRWAQLADIIPIFCLIMGFFFYYQIRVLKWTKSQAALGMCGVILVSFMGIKIFRVPELNGSEGYLGAWLILGILAYWERHEVHNWMLRAFILFFFSLLARSLDHYLCSVFPIGTHFIWHILNAIVIGCGFKSLDMPRLGLRPQVKG